MQENHFWKILFWYIPASGHEGLLPVVPLVGWSVGLRGCLPAFSLLIYPLPEQLISTVKPRFSNISHLGQSEKISLVEPNFGFPPDNPFV